MKSYICNRCHNHCSVAVDSDGFWSNCCGQDLRGADGTILTLPELVKDICEEQRDNCKRNLIREFENATTYKMSLAIMDAPLPEVAGIHF